MKILAAIYSHPEAYPPTLFALTEMSKCAEKITVVCRQLVESKWKYPENVTLCYTTEQVDVFDVEKRPLRKKIGYFLRFVHEIRKKVFFEKLDLVVVYDAIPLFAYSLATIGLPKSKKPKLWYHNHDKADISRCKKFSVSWFAAKQESKLFEKTDFFSLPSNERKKYFPLNSYKGNYFFIPNYPLKSFFASFDIRNRTKSDKIRLLYQGTIGPNHGFEEIIECMKHTVSGKTITLSLVGKIRPHYKKRLQNLAIENNVKKQLIFISPVPYSELPDIGLQHDIGLAIHKPIGITYSTGGTASNKIYEYAAVGMPVLLYNVEHYKQHLADYSWAYFTDLSQSSFLSNLSKILEQYDKKRKNAYNDFISKNHYEHYFVPVFKQISAAL